MGAELGHDTPAVGDHPVGIAGHDLRVELHLGPDDVSDLVQDLEGLAAGGGKDRRVGGHAVDGVVLHQALDGIDVGVVDDELHDWFLSLGVWKRAKVPVPFARYRVCSDQVLVPLGVSLRVKQGLAAHDVVLHVIAVQAVEKR